MTRSSKLLVRSALLTLAFGAVGCGSDGGGKVPSSRKLSSLSKSDVTSLCKEFDRSNPKLIEAQCTFFALYEALFSGGDVSCEESRNECLAEARGVCEDSDLDLAFSGCDATVGELRQCQRDAAALSEKVFAGVTCESDPESFEEELDAVDDPESCLALEKKCPELGDEGEVTLEGLRRFAPRLRR